MRSWLLRCRSPACAWSRSSASEALQGQGDARLTALAAWTGSIPAHLQHIKSLCSHRIQNAKERSLHSGPGGSHWQATDTSAMLTGGGIYAQVRDSRRAGG